MPRRRKSAHNSLYTPRRVLQRNAIKVFSGFGGVTLHDSCTASGVQLMLPHVVIVGGGFGGLAATLKIVRVPKTLVWGDA